MGTVLVYHRVCTNSEIVDAEANGKEKASPLVLTLTPLSGIRMPSFLTSRPSEVRSGEAFVLTSQWHINRDLIEEWIALGRKPLCVHTKIGGIVNLNGYRGPTIECERPITFKNDKMFVDHVESQAEKICGPYLDKEQEAKIASLGSKRRLN